MYLSEKPRPIDLADREMMIEVVSNETLNPHPHHHPHHHHHHHTPHHSQMILGDSSGGDEEPEPEPEHPEHPEPKAPKKRAETWITEETRSLIGFRREVDSLFNTSKSNKHLWEQISAKMREKGFDRSPTMCTDKWRNLLKEFKKARHQQDKSGGNSNSGNGKMSYYKELEELLRSRNRNNSSNSTSNNTNNVSGGGYHQNSTQGHAKVDAFIQFSDKGFDDASIQFGPIEAGGRSTVNLERRLEHDSDPLAITAADAVAPNGVPPWNWRDTSVNGEDPSSYGGKVISVKFGEYTRRIGIDGSADAIKEAIKSAFRLRTKRAFWLEDENNVIRSLDRDMPVGNYMLHLDEGITIKICLYDGSDRIPVTEEKTLYTEDDFRDYLTRRGWIGLREVNSYRSIDCLDDLHSGAMYERL